MSQLVKRFKTDPSSLIVFRAVICFGLVIAMLGYSAHIALATCAGITLMTIFAALAFRQNSQAIEFHDDRIVFRDGRIAVWTLPYSTLGGIELQTTKRNATKYSPGRSVLLRFMDVENKLCAEANVSVYDKDAIRNMIELAASYGNNLILNSEARMMTANLETLGTNRLTNNNGV
ncbi:MAG TPA: hypothetical protein V6C76_02805 [Drouetiella sp.]